MSTAYEAVVVIPARRASTRLPDKVLAPIAGRPMLQWVHERALASGVGPVFIATDDGEVAEVARAFGAQVVLTRADHASGTERLAEVVTRLELEPSARVINVQGDEPLMPPELIRQVAQALLAHPEAVMATLAQCIRSAEELADPAAVKVVTDHAGYALYFSRAPIPVARDGDAAGRLARGATPWRRHLGIYAYRAGFLARYVAWPVTEIEQLEALEQLRALWHGARIHVGESCVPAPQGVDTPADLARVRALLGERA